jgi:hypothetical protein
MMNGTYVEELLDLGVSLERGEGLHREILIAAVDHVQLQVVNLQKAPSFNTKTLVDVGTWASGAASSERGEQRERERRTTVKNALPTEAVFKTGKKMPLLI